MKKKIIFLVNVDSFFVSHRLQVANQLLLEGFEVHIATEFTSHKKILKKKGFITHDIAFGRNSANLFRAFVSFSQIFFLIKRVKPSILHLISLKPSIFGGLVTFISRVPSVVISITGLGSMFLGKNLFSRIRKFFFNSLLTIVFLRKKLKVILQNKSDLNYLIKNTSLKKSKVITIKGSGVDLKKFKFTKLPIKNLIILMVSRIIADKGIYEYIQSARLLKRRSFKGKIYLVGDIDFANPSAIQKSKIDLWKKENIIKYFPYKSDIFKIIKKSTIIVLPSYREGFPKILMEAAASGRPVITTNVPGCRDAIINNVTGILVPPKNYISLAKAILDFSKDKKKLKKIGYAARKHAINNFDVIDVVSKHLSIYRSLIN